MNINNWLTDGKANYCRLLINMKKVLVYANITRGCNFTSLWETASRTPSSLFACAGKSPCYGWQGGTPIPNFRDGMQGPSFPPSSRGGISPCPLGTEKKFRSFLIFQRDGTPQRTVWLVSSSISWAGPQRLGALLGTSTASSGARRSRGGLVPGWAAVSPRAVSRLVASRGGDWASKLPAACSASWRARLRSSRFWISVLSELSLGCTPGSCLLSCPAPPATPCFRPPRGATLMGLCEKQELQQQEHQNK